MLFRGTLRSLGYPDGLGRFLSAIGARLKDFGQFVQRCSQQLASHAEQLAEQAGRPYKYLPSSAINKRQKAQEIAEADGIRQGLICVFSRVEPCHTFQLRRDRETNWLILASAQRKCRFFYFYFMDREFGLLYVRLQSWTRSANP